MDPPGDHLVVEASQFFGSRILPGVIAGYHRGNVRILDRDGLEGASCACYETDKATYTRAMG